MPGPNLSRSFASINDDVRHTYERVFYGRETTADLNSNDVPGMTEGPTQFGGWPRGQGGQSQDAGTVWGPGGPDQPQGGVWGETLSPEAAARAESYPQLEGQIIEPSSNVWGPVNSAETLSPEAARANSYPQLEGQIIDQEPSGNVWGPANSTTPAIEPPAAGNDMTPG